MATICLLLPCFSPGDAVSNDVAGMFTALHERGIDTHILAENWAPDVTFPVEPLSAYTTYAQRSDVISIYHHSTAWEVGHQFFLSAAGPKILRYHNITPSNFFSAYSPRLARETQLGRQQTATLVKSGQIDLFLGDSGYNCQELESEGAPGTRCHILPPFHTLQDLSTTPASVSLIEQYIDHSWNILFLGRVVPNKGHRHLLGVLSAFQQLFSTTVRLFVVGDLDPRFRTYHEELYALARGLQVEESVIWTGKVDAKELKAYLLLSHVFLVMSEHEGFCVPVIEAMAYNIPVLAYSSSAVSETVGNAGLVLTGLDYDHYATALDLLFSRPDIREAQITRQQQRLAEHFSSSTLIEKFWSFLSPFLGKQS